MAIRWLGRDGARREITYAGLAAEAARCAHVLTARGLGRGDRVFALMGREPALYAAALGTLKAGMTFTPLFAAFGPEPVRARMEIGEASALVTTAAQYRRKVADWRASLPSLRRVLIADAASQAEAPEGCVALVPAMAAAPTASRRPGRARRMWRSSISPRARQAGPRGRCMSMPR